MRNKDAIRRRTERIESLLSTLRFQMNTSQPSNQIEETIQSIKDMNSEISEFIEREDDGY